MTSIRIRLLLLFFSAFVTMTARAGDAAEINFSSDRDFSAINLNIKDQTQVNAEFVIISVTLTPPALRRLEEASRNALHQQLTLKLDGVPVNTVTVQSVLKTPRLQLSMSREIAREVLPSLFATPVSSITLSGLSIPPWTLGTWTESLMTDAPNRKYATDEKLSISGKTLSATACKRANHTVVAASDSIVELRIDRRNVCMIDAITVSKMILTKTSDAAQIVVSLYAIGSDLSGPPTKEGIYRRQ